MSGPSSIIKYTDSHHKYNHTDTDTASGLAFKLLFFIKTISKVIQMSHLLK